MFDLLFDRGLRENFCRDSLPALHDYDLDEAEQDDFKQIRPDALELDSDMRTNLVLSQLCKEFPVTFSIASSVEDGFDMLKDLVDTETMRTAPIDRATEFGKRLRERFQAKVFDSQQEQMIVVAITEAELGMAWTSATLKSVVLDGGTSGGKTGILRIDWLTRPVRLASFVCASVVPQPYTQLKEQLCPCTDDLWRHLGRHPVSKSLRQEILKKEDPRLLVSRARISHASLCDPKVDQQTAELSEGFAPLFQHINGTMSVAEILRELRQAGAEDDTLHRVESAFQQLIETGMVETI